MLFMQKDLEYGLNLNDIMSNSTIKNATNYVLIYWVVASRPPTDREIILHLFDIIMK